MVIPGPDITESARAISEGILNGVWQGLLLAAAVAMLVRAIRVVGASKRHLIWLAALAAVATIMVGAALSRTSRNELAAAVGPGGVVTSLTQSAAPVAAPTPSLGTMTGAASGSSGITLNVPHTEWLVIILLILASASALKVARLIVGLVRWNTLRRRAAALPLELKNLAEDLPPAFLRRNPAIRISDELSLPVTMGFLHPTILLPRALAESLTRTELKQIVLHELAHVRRYDDWTNLFQRFLESIFCFNPAVAWIGQRLEVEREIACDEQVVAHFGSKSGYAEFLIQLAEGAGPVRGSRYVAGVASNKTQLARRVQAILTGGGHMKKWHTALAIGGAVAVLSLPWLMTSAGPAVRIALADQLDSRGYTEDYDGQTPVSPPVSLVGVASHSGTRIDVGTASAPIQGSNASADGARTPVLTQDVAVHHLVSGRVTTPELAPLSGVVVALEGSTNSALTNATGQYSIEVANANGRLVFSSPGYATQTVSIEGRSVVDVELQRPAAREQLVSGRVTTPDLEPLAGVTVTLEGATSGAVTNATGDYTIVLPNANGRLVYSLPGYGTRAIGMDEGLNVVDVVMQSRAEVVAESNAMLSRPDVLYVINGVPSTAAEFQRLDPADIERMSTLENPSLAVYGEGARNGVVLVMTRRER